MNIKEFNRQAARLAQKGLKEVLGIKAPMTQIRINRMAINESDEITSVYVTFKEKDYKVSVNEGDLMAEEVQDNVENNDALESELKKESNPKKVVLKAFTGMILGEFEVAKVTPKRIVVKSKKGELIFDKSTGLQVNCDNSRFANRIEI